MSWAAGERRAIVLVLASILSAMPGAKGEPTVTERHWGEKTEGLAISIAVGKDGFRQSDEIVLNIVLGNFGPSVVPIVVRSPWSDYVYTVRDSLGNEYRMNEQGQQRAEASLRRKIIRDLHTGEYQVDDFELSNGIDLKYPGVYTVFATRTFPRPGSRDPLTVRSNSITFQTSQ
jgi:hypothetical protein